EDGIRDRNVTGVQTCALPISEARQADALDEELISLASGLRGRYEEQMEHYAFQNALAEVFKVIGRANKYIDENAPWVLAKDMERSEERRVGKEGESEVGMKRT